ncbi:MAG: sugar transferase, partial [Paracoccus sp. (in: a-proteobacteria)]
VHVIGEAHLRQPIEAFFRHHLSYGLAPDDSRPASVALVTDGARAGADNLAASYRQVILLADMPQLRISGLQPAEVRGAVGLRLPRGQSAAADIWLKRALDLAVAVPMLLVASPVIALAAAAIWIVDPGPVFYTQLREGLNGRPLRVLKLRTMYRDADAALQALLRSDPAALAEWTAHFKLKRDPRILPGIGRLLRRSSCDELPQLLNVIAGGMSLVGPRPFPDYHLAAMRPEFRRKRCSVLPGITGLWQISDRSEADVARQEQLDDFYIDNRSVWLDASILLRTLPAVLLGRGAC